LNNLLQGPIVNEVYLATHAKRLDEQEKSLMSEMGTGTADYIKYIAVCALTLHFLFSLSIKLKNQNNDEYLNSLIIMILLIRRILEMFQMMETTVFKFFAKC
jgi:hypothetical protein